VTREDREMEAIEEIVGTITKGVEVGKEGGDPVPAPTREGTKGDLLPTITEGPIQNLTRDQINNQFKNSIILFLLL
jgi:hypothetical protein